MTRKTYVKCDVTGNWVEKGQEQYESQGPMVIGPLEPFTSPINGERITSRPQLAKHNREHGVTNSADYSREWYARKQEQRNRELNGDTKRQQRERVEAIKSAMGMD